MSNSYPRETVEFQPVTVTLDGAVVTDGISFALTKDKDRPLAWVDSVALSDKVGVMVESLDAGTWHVWVKVVANPETVVLDAGTFKVT